MGSHCIPRRLNRLRKPGLQQTTFLPPKQHCWRHHLGDVNSAEKPHEQKGKQLWYLQYMVDVFTGAWSYIMYDYVYDTRFRLQNIYMCYIHCYTCYIWEKQLCKLCKQEGMHTQMGQKYDRIGQEKMTYQKKHSEMDNQRWLTLWLYLTSAKRMLFIFSIWLFKQNQTQHEGTQINSNFENGFAIHQGTRHNLVSYRRY